MVWDDGSIHHVRLIGAALIREGGRPVVFSGTVKDITEQETAAAAMREAEERFLRAQRASHAMFRNVTDSSSTGLWLSDKEGGITYVNKKMLEWTGIAYENLLADGWLQAIVKEDRQRTADEYFNALEDHRHYNVQFRLRKADGKSIWCLSAGDPYYDEDGSYAGYAGFCMDIDDQVTVRRKIESSQQQLFALFEDSPVAIASISGEDLIICMANPFYCELTDRTEEALIGKPFLEAMPELAGQQFDCLIKEVMATGVPYVTEEAAVDIFRNDKLETIYITLAYQPQRGMEGQISGVLVVATDITQQVTAKRKIEENEARLRNLLTSVSDSMEKLLTQLKYD